MRIKQKSRQSRNSKKTKLRLTTLRLSRQIKEAIKRANKRIKTVCKRIFRSKSRKCMKGG
jgi:hypothetical protein